MSNERFEDGFEESFEESCDECVGVPQVREIRLDTCGLYCPEPVMMLHNAVRDAAVGDVIVVHATDPATTRDIPKFCNFLGHRLLRQTHEGETYIYYVEKKGKGE